jgi:mRNA-degrading endonuclease toxin of MazEF toxin-antitoxin module
MVSTIMPLSLPCHHVLGYHYQSLDSTALIMHLRSVDPKRIIKHVGKLPLQDLERVQEGLKYLFDAGKSNSESSS